MIKCFVIFVVMVFSLFPTLSYAACSNPAGTAGNMVYNSDEKVLQYCNGTGWVGVSSPTSGSGGCYDTAYDLYDEGTVVYNADYNVPQVCSGDTWTALGRINDSAGSGGCSSPTGDEGTIVYNEDEAVMQYCDGDTWQKLFGGYSVVCNTVGQVCADGTIYVDGTIYTTPSDQASDAYWGVYKYSTTASSATDGASNSSIAYVDVMAGNGTYNPDDGYEPNIFIVCHDLEYGGHDDWYVPAEDQLTVLYNNQDAIGNFEADYYWSSSGVNDNYDKFANRRNFGTGADDYNARTVVGNVRCVRNN